MVHLWIGKRKSFKHFRLNGSYDSGINRGESTRLFGEFRIEIAHRLLATLYKGEKSKITGNVYEWLPRIDHKTKVICPHYFCGSPLQQPRNAAGYIIVPDTLILTFKLKTYV